jgi:hypothetical protein
MWVGRWVIGSGSVWNPMNVRGALSTTGEKAELLGLT